MTKELMNIWRQVDRIGLDTPGLADELEEKLLNDYLEKTCYIIPEEDWEEIQTRGYDIEMMCEDADEQHADDSVWIETVANSLIDQETEVFKNGDVCLINFWRGYYAGKEINEISIPDLGINGEMLL